MAPILPLQLPLPGPWHHPGRLGQAGERLAAAHSSQPMPALASAPAEGNTQAMQAHSDASCQTALARPTGVAFSARGVAAATPARTTLSPCRKRTPGGMQHRLGQATAGWAVARPSEGHAAGALLLHELDTSLPVLPGPGTASYAARHTPAPPASKWPCHAMRQRCASLRAWPFLFLAEASLLDSRMRLTFSRAAQTCNSIALVTPPRSGGGARPPRCAPPGSAR